MFEKKTILSLIETINLDPDEEAVAPIKKPRNSPKKRKD